MKIRLSILHGASAKDVLPGIVMVVLGSGGAVTPVVSEGKEVFIDSTVFGFLSKKKGKKKRRKRE